VAVTYSSQYRSVSAGLLLRCSRNVCCVSYAFSSVRKILEFAAKSRDNFASLAGKVGEILLLEIRDGERNGSLFTPSDLLFLWCFDTVGWVTGRAVGL